MSFPRYPKTKPSGVEWLGDVPEHWEVSKIKHTTYLKARVGWKGLTSEEFRENAYAYLVTGSDFRSKFVKWDECYQVEQVRYEDDPFIQLQNGDLLITKDGTIGKLAIVSDLARPACLNSGIFVTRPRNTYTTEFMYWILSSNVFTVFCDLESFGSTINHLYQNVFERFTFPAPPPSEQTAIASFLDHETGKIDVLVEEQRRLIALLKEKRQAVISHAVTKGLNPHAPMKPSGVEWLGDVPEHWEVKRLKYLMSLTSGGTPRKENLSYWDGNVPWASSKDLKSDELLDTQDHISQKALDEGAAELVPAGSILTVVRGMILLHTFPVVIARVPMAINQDLKAILPTAGIDADFLAWLLRGASDEVLSRTDEAGHGTKVLRMETWLEMQVPVPPLKEQSAIVAAIIRQLGELDTLTTEANRAVELLQERRTALISAAVTGKIDVRDFQHG